MEGGRLMGWAARVRMGRVSELLPNSSEEIEVLSQPSRRVFVSILTHRVTKREMYHKAKEEGRGHVTSWVRGSVNCPVLTMYGQGCG